MVMNAAMFRSETQQFGVAIFMHNGRVKEWTLSCDASVEAAFTTLNLLRRQMLYVFAPPNQAYRVRSRFSLPDREIKTIGLGSIVEVSFLMCSYILC